MSLSHATKGKIIKVTGDKVVFRPTGSTYELHLVSPGYSGPLDELVEVVIRGSARKAYTVPSGGLFVSPIMGTPKVLQGRVKDLAEDEITLHCGVPINIKLSKEAGAIELARGPIAVNVLVNVILLAGASAEIKTAVAVA